MEDAVNLPGFTEEGLLPPGDYELTLEELAASYLVWGRRPTELSQLGCFLAGTAR